MHCLARIIIVAILCMASPTFQNNVQGETISGIVIDDKGIGVPDAVVSVQTMAIETITDSNGYFLLETDLEKEINLTAWASGFFISGPFTADRSDNSVTITLQPHSLDDNINYQWVSAHSQPDSEDNCQLCHSDYGNKNSLFPYDEWLQDAHSGSAQNPLFLSMYLGTDLDGNKSPLRQFAWDRDYGMIPLPPDPNEPYYGPGFKLDFPALDGNCATCHAPLSAVNEPYGVNPDDLTGVDTEGISCDFCHKIWSVDLNETTKLPGENMTGVLSYEFMRPMDGHQFFAGPLKDVAPGEDTYLPLQSESAFCAPCHYAVFGDTLVYNSYGEWLESPYSDPQSGQTCQECHMPLRGADHFAVMDKGGLTRDSNTLRSHRMTGVGDLEFMENALTMDVEANIEEAGLEVSVTLTNDNTGHHIPTGNPMRHMILVVNAFDEDGTLTLVNGPVIPEWCGDGDNEDDFAGLPGRAYAKVLEDTWSREYPTGSYWNSTKLVSDNRIAAFASDTTEYLFSADLEQDIWISAKLYYRRGFKKIMEQKGWKVPDMLIKESKLRLSPYMDQQDECITVPDTSLHFRVEPLSSPICSTLPSKMNPFGFGQLASGGTAMDVRISLECFTAKVDLFFAVIPPESITSEILFFCSDNTLKPFDGEWIPWRRDVSEPLDYTLFSNIDLSELSQGNYIFLLLVTPSGNIDQYYLWETIYSK
ncbi:exported hypothetical protein [Desulfamplus magnetovallimortis]|uniref:Uncharacterized protein n=1 Tax=Desulfamplus magnetovallimortis TaxID=1246637 RepID=A0A1W1HHK2_9BACT|nr:carboxypeptidase-like regulatory domain-containing protein [Desulfamplus magnetovallimortis]SLM31977.1 exported hypothetical protein [Desulfamplus magnetovallimortis]